MGSGKERTLLGVLNFCTHQKLRGQFCGGFGGRFCVEIRQSLIGWFAGCMKVTVPLSIRRMYEKFPELS